MVNTADELPDWLGTPATAEATTETDLDDLAGWLNEPAAEIEEEGTADDLDWLGGAAVASTADELPDWLGTPETAEATAETDLDDLAGWLSEPAAEIEEEETADDLDWLGGAAVASTADELPDWLGTPATAEATIKTDLDDLAGWLSEPAAEIEEEETADDLDWLGGTAVANSADELPDWLGTPQTAEATTETDLDDLAGWLSEPTAEIEEEETADALDWLGGAAVATAQDELPDWLGTPATAETTAEADLEDLAGWLNEPAAEIEEEETADGLDWLGGAAVVTAQDKLPDWLGTPQTAEATTETDLDDLAGWLSEPAAEIEEEETADDLDWLGGAAVATAQDELPDWLGTPATAEATTESDLDDLAGWLNEPTAEIEEEETADDLDWLGGAAVASAADELPDWLGTPQRPKQQLKLT